VGQNFVLSRGANIFIVNYLFKIIKASEKKTLEQLHFTCLRDLGKQVQFRIHPAVSGNFLNAQGSWEERGHKLFKLTS
jgi:hypothetical protein